MKNQIRKIKNNKRGTALVLAAVMVLILLLIGIGLIQLGSNARMQGVKDVLQVSARSAADAGIEHAVRYMIDSWNAATDETAWLAGWNNATVWTNPAVPATPVNYSFGPVSLGGTFGGANFTYNIYKGTQGKGYQIISTGTAAGKTRIVHAAVILSSPFAEPNNCGLLAKGNIYIYPNTILSTIPAGNTLTIQTNSILPDAITLKPNITVPGDVVVGPGGDPDTSIDLAKNSVILGEDRAADDYISFPPVDRPNDLPVGTPTPVGSDYLIDHDMRINGGFDTSSTLYIGNPAGGSGLIRVYVVGPTNLNSHAKLIVNSGYSLELYLGGNMYTAPNVDISYTTIPPVTETQIIDATGRITIKGTPDCASILLQPNGNFYGIIYAPDSSLTMQPGGDFYGAIIGAADITLKPGGAFNYTLPSSDTNSSDPILFMGIKPGSWWEE